MTLREFSLAIFVINSQIEARLMLISREHEDIEKLFGNNPIEYIRNAIFSDYDKTHNGRHDLTLRMIGDALVNRGEDLFEHVLVEYQAVCSDAVEWFIASRIGLQPISSLFDKIGIK